MTRNCISAVLSLAIIFCAASTAYAHCQVPCGIYDEGARFTAMREDASTIAKATKMIHELNSKTDANSAQQLVRWTMTKEDHATRIITTVAEYFLTQKIKPADPKKKKAYASYIEQLKSCHVVMRAAMATKQKADANAVDTLESAIERLAATFGHAHKK